MIVNTPDGQVNFPDSMSDDDVKGVLQKKYGAPKPDVPLFSLTGPDKIGEFFGKAGDTATFGLGAKLQDALGIAQGPHGETVAQQVENAGKDIGPYASAGADALGYIAGPGELRVGEGLGKLIGSGLSRGIGENVASRVGGRMIGSAAENVGATALGNYGHDESTTTGDLLKSAALGAATGMLPGGAGKRPTTPSSADLQSTASGLYKPLESKVYQSPDVAAALDKVGTNVSQGLQSKISSNLSDQIDRINRIVAKGGGTTASDIADFRSSLQGASRGKPDQAIVGQYLAELEKRVGPSMAAKINEAAGASNVAKTSGEIEGWAASPSGAPKAVRSALEANPQFYSQPGLFDALNAVGKKAPSSDPSISSEVGKAVGKHLLGMAAGGAAGYLFGGNPLEDIAGAALGAAVPSALGRFRSIPTKNALLAAQHLNATGMKVDPGVYMNPLLQGFGILARQGGYAAGASGAF